MSSGAVDEEEEILPPPDAHIPVAPPGFVPMLGNDFRGVPPRRAHMAALPDVIEELDRFADFVEVFGKTMPPHTVTRRVVQAAFAWSKQRAQMRAWDKYCRTQEGLAWRELRQLMNRLAAAYDLAVRTDSTIASKYPGFARLFGASREVAKRALATRRANETLRREGKARFRGAAGARRQRAAARALLAKTAPSTNEDETTDETPGEPDQ